MMEEIDRFQVPSAVQEAEMQAEMQPLDPASSTASEADSDTREGEPVTINYKPSPLQMKIEKQRELARKGSLKNSNTVGSPVNQQPKKNNVMARTRLVVPNKGYSSLDQSPDEKPLVALDTDSDDDFDMSRYSSSGYSSAEVRCVIVQICICTLLHYFTFALSFISSIFHPPSIFHDCQEAKSQDFIS
uniref:Family with sequence similarity 219 member A n=1 Tax=Seriola dumerili TaxID=41447 RepID=A0A3B4V4Z1_SERDU